MRRILLASHAALAEGMKSTIEMVAGKVENLTAVCAYTDGIPDIKRYLEHIVENLNHDDELLIVTDVLGGSVNNEAAQFRCMPNVFVVAGMNLALVLNLVISTEPDTEKLIRDSVESAKSQMVYMEKTCSDEEEDF